MFEKRKFKGTNNEVILTLSFVDKYIILNNLLNLEQKDRKLYYLLSSRYSDFIEKLVFSSRYPYQAIDSCLNCSFYKYMAEIKEFLKNNKNDLYDLFNKKVVFGSLKISKKDLNYCSYCSIFVNILLLNKHKKFAESFVFTDDITFEVIEYNNNINNTITRILSQNFFDLINIYLLKPTRFNKSKFFIAPLLNDYYIYDSFLFINNISKPEEICIIYKEKYFKFSAILSMLHDKAIKIKHYSNNYIRVILPLYLIKDAKELIDCIIYFENNNVFSFYTQIPHHIKVKILSFYYPYKILYTLMNSILTAGDDDIELFLLSNDYFVNENLIKDIGQIISAIDPVKEFISV